MLICLFVEINTASVTPFCSKLFKASFASSTRSNVRKHIQDTTGRYVGCLEELALYEGWVTEEQVHAIGDELSMTLYGKYLQCL